MSTPIDRETASRINPLISELFTEDTLDQCARLVRDLGYFLSQVDNPPEGTEPRFGNLYLITSPIAAALDYEVANPHLTSGNQKKESRHV